MEQSAELSTQIQRLREQTRRRITALKANAKRVAEARREKEKMSKENIKDINSLKKDSPTRGKDIT